APKGSLGRRREDAGVHAGAAAGMDVDFRHGAAVGGDVEAVPQAAPVRRGFGAKRIDDLLDPQRVEHKRQLRMDLRADVDVEFQRLEVEPEIQAQLQIDGRHVEADDVERLPQEHVQDGRDRQDVEVDPARLRAEEQLLVQVSEIGEADGE